MKKTAEHAEGSLVWTLLGVLLFFSFAIGVTLISPRLVDPTWTEATSHYQIELHEVGDPNFFISNSVTGTYDLQFVSYLEAEKRYSAFIEGERSRIVAPDALKGYITHHDQPVKLTHRLLLLRHPTAPFKEQVEKLQDELKGEFEKEHPLWKEKAMTLPTFQVLELYDPKSKEAFVTSSSDESLEDYADHNFILLEPVEKGALGYLYIKNPVEYRVREIETPAGRGFQYAANGKPIGSLQGLKDIGFWSRKELIAMGEEIYAHEGCWYCHTDQTRTLVQDVVLNGSDSYPAPPSSASEYIYQGVTFPGTRRIGPDISRTGVKRPSRDWHRAHFWAPKTASPGSIMPSFQHFFDDDPRGTPRAGVGVPNLHFEAIYQYLMTKGTRLTAPSKAWWLGKDPVKTKEIIEGGK